LAPENVAFVKERAPGWGLPCPVEARVGSVSALPYPDDAFDAVWCANTTQYFGDEDLPTVMAELRRVVRPGGLVTVKDVDMNLLRLYPADPFLVSHLSEASLRAKPVTAESRGSLRGRELRRWLEKSGLTEVRQRTTLIERWAPLRPVEKQFFGEWLAYLAGLAEERGVPKTDLATWRSVRDAAASDHLLDHPDFYACEGQVVAVGQVPSAGSRGLSKRA
jgi:SAM-dependent methyltransferase